jgi:hypothetical protein
MPTKKKPVRATLRCPEGCPKRFKSKLDRREHLETVHGVELPANLPIAKHVPDEKILAAVAAAQKFVVVGPSAPEIAPKVKITDRAVRQRLSTLIRKGLVARDAADTGYIVTPEGAAKLAALPTKRKGA